MSKMGQTEHALYMFSRTFQKYKNQSFISISSFSDGLIFAHMLEPIQYCSSQIATLHKSPQKWTSKLTILKKLLNVMQNFVESQHFKHLKINDIQPLEIAKNSSTEETLKMFEVVIAVLMLTPEKQDYIQTIMSLDQRSQQALAIVVQNAMEYRILDIDSKEIKNLEQERIQTLQNESEILIEQINQLCLENQAIQKQYNQVKNKLHESLDEIEKTKSLHIEMFMNRQNSENEEKGTIELLKSKMIAMSRQHEMQLAKLNEENDQLKLKYIQSKDTEQQACTRAKMLEEKLKIQIQQIQTERKKKERQIEQKDTKIRKLEYELEITKSKARQLSENLEVNDLNLRMQLEKKQVRFKQLEKQVKSRLIDTPRQALSSKLINESNNNKISQQHQEQLEYLKLEVQKLRNTNRQLQRQSLKQKKKTDKVAALEVEKKKLEKIILQVSRCRDSQIQMLVVSLYELRTENIKMNQIITKLRSKEQSKND